LVLGCKIKVNYGGKREGRDVRRRSGNWDRKREEGRGG
jgi:hypothetical protein